MGLRVVSCSRNSSVRDAPTWCFCTDCSDAARTGAASPARTDRPILELGGAAAYVYAPIDGVFEPFHDLGEHVSAGQPAGRIHRIWDLTAGPVTVHYAADGIVYGQRHPGRVALGNCCVVVASPYGGPSR